MTQADDIQARNAHVIAEFRANHGQVGGDFAGAPLLLLHTVGEQNTTRTIPVIALTPTRRDDGANSTQEDAR